MLDPSSVKKFVGELETAADVDIEAPDRAKLLETVGQYDALWIHVDQRIDKEIFQHASRLKVINTASTGTDHIDVKEAERRGIRVLSITKDYGLLDQFTATAECAWMLLLASCRHLRAANRHVLEGGWDTPRFTGQQLSNMTLGVLGVGRLGGMVCKFGPAFRMRVLGCDLKPFDLPDVEQVDFDTLLASSDAISIHIHMLRENYHLFNEHVFDRMKPGAVLVNTSRGDIIDETALLKALDSGRLAAFGADVLHNEWRSDMRESPIVRYAQEHDNVLITPHIGGASTLSIDEARLFSARKLAHYLQTGEELTMR
jgi:D-3-phosphoglycerate dehydrogenase